MTSYWDDKKTFDGNILFFPTVISELSEIPDEIGQFCEGLEHVEFVKDTIFLMVSYRSNASFSKDWRFTDWQKMQKVIATLEKKGYVAESLPIVPPKSWQVYLQREKPKRRTEGLLTPTISHLPAEALI